MPYKKLTSLLLIFLIMNLNMVVPAVSYASAEETCACHLNSADHQCHCEEECKGCGMHQHKSQESEVRSQKKVGWAVPTSIKGMSCSNSPQNDNTVLPILGIPFLVPDFCHAIPAELVTILPRSIESPIYGVTIAPSEKPPTV